MSTPSKKQTYVAASVVFMILTILALSGVIIFRNFGNHPLGPQAIKAREAFAEHFDIAPEKIKVVSTEKTTFGDSTLGTGGTGLQVLTPGYRITMKYKGTTYYANTNGADTIYLLDEDDNVIN